MRRIAWSRQQFEELGHVAGSAISRQIANLEQALDVPLFDRRRSGTSRSRRWQAARCRTSWVPSRSNS
ncbi:MAG: LysR family transcriptional regulator [Variovorax sp.]